MVGKNTNIDFAISQITQLDFEPILQPLYIYINAHALVI